MGNDATIAKTSSIPGEGNVKKSGFTIDNFPAKLRGDCLKVARNRDMTLTQFVTKWMTIGLKRERKILAAQERRERAREARS